MKYLREFTNHSDYEAYIGGSDALLPNVSICNDEKNIVHYNPYVEPTSPYVVAKFYVEDDSEPTAISGIDYYGEDPTDYFSRIWIDGEEMEEINTYASLSNGEHTIEYELIDNTEISDQMFHMCHALTYVTIPNTVTSIGWAFQECENLKNVTIPNSVTSIGDSAFDGCRSLTSITIPNSVTNIGEYAFSSCRSLTSITIPNSVTNIGEYAFSSCRGLTSITIPKGVTSMGYSVFEACSSLTSVIISNSVTSIGHSIFRGCTALASIIVEEGNQMYDSRENCNAIIETYTNTLIFGCKNTIIPNSVTSIGDDAFYGCDGLTSVNIPNSVTSIGEKVFYGCDGLTSITIPNSVMSIGIGAFLGSISLTTMTVEATTPPTLANTNVISTATTVIYVPSASVNAYKTASIWSSFASKIQPIP